ncbi:hypothetical protein Tco_0919674, partial [Tanacetum coccineum]
SEAKQISWKSSDEEDDDEVNMGNDNDDDDDNQNDDEESDEEIQGVNVEEEELDEEETNDEDEANELYRDVNVNLEGRDIEMTDAQQNNQSSSVSSGFISNMLNPSPDTSIDYIFNLNTESTSLIDVPITTIAELPLFSTTTLPPPPTPLIIHLFDHRLKTLENDFSEFKQTNQFAAAVSSIPGIVDTYLANKMNEAVKIVVQLQSDKLRDEAQVENEVFLNKLDDNIKKIIKDQVKEQVKAQVSKILLKIKKTKNLYKALVNAYESDKLILDTYRDNVLFKRRRDDEDKDEEPSAGSNRGSKRRRAGKEPESTSAPKEKTSKTTGKSTKGSKSHHKSAGESAQFKTGVTEDHPDEETSQLPDWFQKPAKPTTPDRDWTKTLPNTHGPVQPWLSSFAHMEDPRELFNEPMDTPLDFSAFMMNWLKVDTLTPELLVGLTFKLMKGSCKSLVELEYFFEEVYKATTDQLDWNNPEDQQYPHDLRTYTTSVTKTEAADYGNIKWIEDLVPNTMWSQVPVSYDKHALWGISHWGRKRKQFYGFVAKSYDPGDRQTAQVD